MTPAARRLIETELGIPVVATYQAVEALRIGFECEARNGYHLSTDQVEVRVVKPDGRDAGPGERGELVLSNLTNRATVVLNYRLGDLVTVCGHPCPCGRKLPKIDGIDGRLDDLIVRPDGSRLHMLSLVPSLQAVRGVHQVQIIQEDYEIFRLAVVPAAGRPPDPEELRLRMIGVVGAAARVSVGLVDQLEMQPSGKVKTVVCRIVQDAASPGG
jgi:phenylacetate-CoA ligase